MKNTALYILLLLLSPVVLVAQSAKDVKFAWTDATDLTMLGQFFPENPNPYHRVDTTRFKGFTAGENRQVRCGVGMICAFRTNSTIISVDPQYGDVGFPTNTMGISARGFDLYIRKDGQWINAASTVSGDKSLNNPVTLISNMDGEEKECLIYLPIQSELRELKIGVQEGKTLLPLENPFRHRIAFFGSSFTHGSSTSRPAMNYPSQLSRATESRGGSKRPQLSDLRESGAIEQDADLVAFIHRPEYYGLTTDENGMSTAGMAEIIIAKHRNGEVTDVRMRFIKEQARFANLEMMAQGEQYSNFDSSMNSTGAGGGMGISPLQGMTGADEFSIGAPTPRVPVAPIDDEAPF